MDVRASSAIAKASGAAHAAATLRRLSPLQTKIRTSIRKNPQTNSQIQYRIFTRRTAVKAASPSGNQFGSGGRSRVDAEMIVLRKRTQELRMQETNYAPPQHWMKWEKEWSVTYASDICEFMGGLQNMLINRRPGHAIAVLVLISLSVPTFVLLLLLQFFQLTSALQRIGYGISDQIIRCVRPARTSKTPTNILQKPLFH